MITYTYVVTNTGNVTVPGQIFINDSRLVVICPPTTGLAPGGSLTCTVSYSVTQADLDAGKIVNVAAGHERRAVTSPAGHGDRGCRGEAAARGGEVVADEALSAPQTVNYSYLVTNAGNVTLTGIASERRQRREQPELPATTTLAPTRVDDLHRDAHFTQAELDANGSPVAGSGVLKNTVTATSNQAQPATDDLEIPIVLRPALTLVKSATPLSYNQVGQVITYTYTVTNTGNVTVLGQISVTDDKVTVVCPPHGVAGAGRVDHLHGVSHGHAGGSRRGPDRERRLGLERRRSRRRPTR